MSHYSIQDIYDTLCGDLLPDACVPGVENAFAPGSACERLYAEACDAREQVCQRLGVRDEDPDLERVFSALLDIARELSFHMYLLGRTLPRQTGTEE